MEFLGIGKGGILQPDGWNLNNLSKKELALLKQKGVAPKSAALPPVAPKTGTVMPPQGAIKPPIAGLLGVDPVATQQQSRVPPTTPAPKPIYVDTAGNAGRSVPKGAGTSGIYADPTDAAKVAAKGGPGMLQKAGGLLARGALGPAGLGLQLMAGGEGLSDGERPKEYPPEMIDDARKYAAGIKEKATQAANPKSGAGLLMAGQPQEQAQAAPAGEMAWPDLPVAEEPAQEDPQIAQERAFLSQKVKSDLSEGKVSKPKLAEQAVDAQLQQSGQKVTPEERKELIKEETGFFRKMDDEKIADYMSAFMVGGGIYLTLMGDAAGGQTMFAQGNKFKQDIIDQKDKEAAAVAAAAEAEREEYWKNREAERKEADVLSQIETRSGNLNYKGQELGLKEQGLGLEGDRVQVAKDRLEGDQNYQQAQIARMEAQTAFGDEKLKIERKLADARMLAAEKSGSGGNITAPALSYEDNKELAKAYFKAQGLKVDDGVLESTAQQLITLQKNGSDLSVDEMMADVTRQFNVAPGEPASTVPLLGWEIPWTGKDPMLTYKKTDKE